jgi:hypothetical protein
MATPHAIRYREKARELYEAAASATDNESRKQFTGLARQYEQLATWTEGVGQYEAATADRLDRLSANQHVAVDLH